MPSASSSTLMPGIAQPRIDQGTRNEQAPLYHVVLLDDNDHTYEYVIEMLMKLFACSEAAAWNHAVEVDSSGRTIVITCELPQAEFGRDQIRAYGADPRMPRSRSSMSAVVEPAR